MALIIVLGERHLRHLLKSYHQYYKRRARTCHCRRTRADPSSHPDRRSDVGRANFGRAAPSIYASVSFRQERPAKSTGLDFTADSSLPVRVSHQRALANLSPWRRCARPFPHSSNHRYSIDIGRELHTCRCDPHKEARLGASPVDLLRERRHQALLPCCHPRFIGPSIKFSPSLLKRDQPKLSGPGGMLV
jgi:hypothetical protein